MPSGVCLAPATGEGPRSLDSLKTKSVELDSSSEEQELARENYVKMLGDEVFEAFTRRREAALRAAAEMRKMKLMTRHSVRFFDAHDQSPTHEFCKFLEFAELQRQKEARRAKLLGLPPRSAPANVFSVRPVGKFGLAAPDSLTREEWAERRSSANRYLRMQMERIQNIRVSHSSRIRSTPSLQAVNLSDVTRRKTRRATQFSAEFLQDEPPHYALVASCLRPATVPAETQAELYRWMEEFFREHVPVAEVESLRSRSGKRSSVKDSQLRDEQTLDQLCSIASALPSYIVESPWYVQRKSVSQRGSKYDHLHAPPVKEPRREMRIDVELAAQLQARKLQAQRKTPQPRTPRLGKRKRRPQTAQSSPLRMNVEYAEDTILNSAVLVKSPTKRTCFLQLQEAAVSDIESVRYISLASRGISAVNSQELASFTSLRCLDLSGNHVPLMRLAPLTFLRKLILLGNQQAELEIPKGSFQALEVLDVSYNFLNDMAVIALSSLPSLRKLNMNNNYLELIPPEATETGAFARLETLCVAGNSLSSTSLVSLSKLPWLETLHLNNNHINGIPDQIASVGRAFSRLETLDLAENPISFHHHLLALETMHKLRKVFLWDTPLSRTISYDGLGKCSPRSVPILHAAMRAQRAGQNWFLVKTDNVVIKSGCYSEKLTYSVDNEQPGMSRDEKIKARLEKSRRVEEEVQMAMLRNNAGRRMDPGPTSLIAQSPETNEAGIFIADSRKGSSNAKKSPRRRSDLEGLVNEEMKRIQNVPSPIEPYLSQAQAAVAAARKSLGLSPHEVKDTPEGQPSYEEDRLFLLGKIAWKKATDRSNKRSSGGTRSRRPSTDHRTRTPTDTSSNRPSTEQRPRSSAKPKQGA